ncbi:glycosyltransferase [Enterocloster aldenensis]|uniref:glycosyltransferase family 2 protein n=1 Tax=Enterocloster aldenensis TaxID=358742 RepID=UPI000E4893A9|nr:glycosyltransferase [Enterocloster aldenensis]
MYKPLVSIIVPVYNAYKYIDKCLSSISKQRYKNIEVIIIDDGSTDGSANICDCYVNADKRFRVIHQKNQGRVLARAKGVNEAKGEYIGFVDGDDWIEDEMYEYLMNIALKCDVDLVTSGYIEEGNICRRVEDSLIEKEYRTSQEKECILANFLFGENMQKPGMIFSQCTKIYRSGILKNTIKKIPTKMCIGEDCLLNITYILKAKSIYISKKAYYHYRIHCESTIHSMCEDYLSHVNLLFTELKAVFTNLKNHRILLRQLDKMIVSLTVDGLNQKIGLSGSIYMPWYMFDINGLEGKRIILYGAGAVGKDFFFQIQKQTSISLILWVDQKYKELNMNNYKISDVDMISNTEFDQILVAVKHESLAKKIVDDLCEKYSVPRNCITWKQPKEIYILDT